MLVLSRKAGEKIQIGDGITLEVRRVAGNRVTLAIEAPKDVRILRGELEKVVAQFNEPEPTVRTVPPVPRSDSRFGVNGRGLAGAVASARMRGLRIG
ncbi:hypothetical protein Pla175_10510 [Pirellulimonas nuda]|uniref:Translational regulator CsrA n=1 Tax=Pirellulimonas nuda TaxID=2528009 RepID=A0A518D8A5_9BACT|nr:carbon storage regulator [Pirellulimonas nuda]QDU87685.1 hypothetical protein Pla175_10510 [Pirellulimonas nuda]